MGEVKHEHRYLLHVLKPDGGKAFVTEHVTEVTPAPHEKPASPPSVSPGLCRCLQQPGLPALKQPAALMIPTSPRLAVTDQGYFSKLLLLSIFLLGGCGDIKVAAGRRRAFLTLAPSFISLFHRPCQ